MEMTKGDWENLEDKIIIYGKEKNREGVLGLYVTADPVDFKEQMDIPQSVIDNVVYKNDEDAAADIKMYAGTKNYSSEQELLDSAKNALCIGEFENEKLYIDSLRESFFLFIHKYTDQFLSKLDFDLEKEESDSYKDINDNEFNKYILDNYVIPMIDDSNNNKDISKLKKDFIVFSKGSHFITDVYNLCTHIEQENMDTEIIEAYIKKITAIKKEEWREAGKQKKIIDKRINQ